MECGGRGSVLQKEEELLTSLEKWLRLEENVYLNAKTDRKSLLCFIRGSKHNQEKAKNKLLRFYEMKARVPEWFQNRDPEYAPVKEVLGLGVFIPLLKRDRLNRSVFILRTGVHNPRRHKQADVFKVSKMLLDLVLRDDETVAEDGVIGIFDMKHVGLGHALQMTPGVIKNSVESIQNYPCKTKNLIFVNSPVHINVILNIFRSFMSAKIKQRVKVYGTDGFDKLIQEKILPLDILPDCYGGTAGPIELLIEHWKKKAIENKGWFHEDENFKANLSGRA